MTRLILAAGVAALAVTAPASAKPDRGAASMHFRGAGFANRLLYRSSNKGPIVSGR